MTYPGNSADAGLPPRSISNVPVPDPSALTTERMQEAVSNLKNLLEVQIKTLQKDIEDFKRGHEENHRITVAEALKHRAMLGDSQQATLKTQVDAQFAAIQKQISILTAETAEKASETDLRYQQRYDAQTDALEAAFKAQQERNGAALAAQKEAVQVALVTVKEATTKTEAATDKLMPRSEAESRFRDLEQQVERRFTDLDRNIKATLEALSKSITVSDASTEKRFITIYDSIKMISQLSDRISRVDEAVKGTIHSIDEKHLTLRTLIESQGEKIAISATAADRAVTKAEVANEKRFEVNTGLTQQLAEQTKTFLTRVEFMAVTDSLDSKIVSMGGALADKIEDLRKSRDPNQGRAAASPTQEAQIQRLADEVRGLRDFRELTTGKSTGLQAGWGYLVGGIGLVIAVVSIVIALVTKI